MIKGLLRGYEGITRGNTHTHTHTHTHAHTHRGTRTRGRVRMRACLHKHASTHTCKCTRTLARAYMCVPEHVVNVFVCMGVCVRAVRVCVGESVSVGASLNLSMFACTRGCARASACVRGGVCARTRVRTAATCGIHGSAGGAGRPRVRGCGSVRSALGVARVGRRCDVDKPHDQRAVGCARSAHVGGRRGRRHLRPRRLQWQLPQRRVGRHR